MREVEGAARSLHRDSVTCHKDKLPGLQEKAGRNSDAQVCKVKPHDAEGGFI